MIKSRLWVRKIKSISITCKAVFSLAWQGGNGFSSVLHLAHMLTSLSLSLQVPGSRKAILALL